MTDAAGAALFDRQTILRGQEIFLKYGLMEHGTLWGHGAYLGPDYSAEYLHRLAEICNDPHAGEGPGRTEHALKQNRYEPVTGTLVFTPCEAASFDTQQREWHEYFRGSTPPPGLPPLLYQGSG